MKQKQILMIVLSAIILALLTFFIFQKDDEENGVPLQKTVVSEDESIVYLGNETAKHEVLFIFDYSCSWCHTWLGEIYPVIDEFTEGKNVKIRTQSLAILNEFSLQLSNFDQNLKEYYPEKYFEVFFQIFEDGKDGNYAELLDGPYLEELMASYQLDKELMLAEPTLSVSQLTEGYANAFQIDSVPTIMINGEKVEDPFDIESLKNSLK